MCSLHVRWIHSASAINCQSPAAAHSEVFICFYLFYILFSFSAFTLLLFCVSSLSVVSFRYSSGCRATSCIHICYKHIKIVFVPAYFNRRFSLHALMEWPWICVCCPCAIAVCWLVGGFLEFLFGIFTVRSAVTDKPYAAFRIDTHRTHMIMYFVVFLSSFSSAPNRRSLLVVRFFYSFGS